MMIRVVCVFVLLLALTACSTIEPPVEPDCVREGEEETDGGVGGTGHELCEEDERME